MMNQWRNLIWILAVFLVGGGIATAQWSDSDVPAAEVLRYWQEQILVNRLPVADPENWAARNLTKFSELTPERLALAQRATSLAEVEQLIASAPFSQGAPLNLLLAAQPRRVSMISTGAESGNGPSTRVVAKNNPTANPTLYSDLVFTALTPCRILDSRPSQGGEGIWLAGSTNIVHIGPYSSYAPYGGSATNCGLSTLATTGQIAAIMAAVSSFNQGGNGFLTFFSFGATNPAPYGVSQSYSPSSGILTSFVIIPTDLAGLVYAWGYTQAQTNVTIDVVGYFAKPVGLFDCLSPSSLGTDLVVTNGTTSETLYSPACPTGYASVGGSCGNNVTSQVYLMSQGTSTSHPGQYFCSFRNLSGADQNVTASNRCCKIPGGR